MAETYRLGPARKVVNLAVRAMLALRVAPPNYALMTVVGRTSGRRYSTPIRPVENADGLWLVAPYGPVGWVRNARAAGQVTLTRRGRARTVDITECDATTAGPVLRAVPVTRPFFDAGPDDPVDSFVAEADRHPVFRVVEPSA